MISPVSSGSFPETVSRHFERQAAACARLGSPFTGWVCANALALVDPGSATGRRLAAWPGNPADDALALRLAGALHAIVLKGMDGQLAAAYPPNEPDENERAGIVATALARHDDFVAGWIDGPPQTNELARAAMLLPGLLLLARETGLPLALREIGSSAGLILLFDRFRYDYGGAIWGDEASPVRLAPEIIGAAPPLDGELVVASRKGSDIAPVDISRPDARERLLCYIWPDQPYRLERTRAAFELAAAHPYTVERRDAADFVEAELAARRPGEAFVLFHSIMWQYMPAETQAAIATSLAEAGARATAIDPIAWLRMEPAKLSDPMASLTLTLWPGGETRLLARCDYHGRAIEWLG